MSFKSSDYALHDVIRGTGTGKATQHKRWWMKRILGPNGAYYARLLFGLEQ